MDLQDARRVIDPLRQAMYDWTDSGVCSALDSAIVADAPMQLAFPFETMEGPAGWFGSALGPLAQAFPDLERRDYIVMAGTDAAGATWVGCAGDYAGTWWNPFLNIPATGKPASMRFHEFFRIEDGRVVEMQALWDLPELMMQSGSWPMAPALGSEGRAPAPATQDGLIAGEHHEHQSQQSLEHIVGMLTDMGRHPNEPEEVMRLEHWWHPRFSWYGPVGIGTSRGVDGFRANHQIPFLRAMPDRRGSAGSASPSHFFADGNYVGVTAWPGMEATVTGDGWMGIVPNGREITMRSLDFWRVEQHDGRMLIRENWVLVDLLSVYDQLGVDVLARMREITSHRRGR